MRLKFIVVLVMCMLLFESAFAFDYFNHSIDKVYSANENIRGKLNISFTNENINSIISSNFLGTIKLIDLLDRNTANYTCNPLDCSYNYVNSNPSINKSFSLSYGQEKLVSFLINESLSHIVDLRFNFSVENADSCNNPLKIDLFDDGSIEWKSNKVGRDFSCVFESGTGCFNANEQSVEGEIGQQIYCEKIKLMASERFRLGAWVKKGDSSWSSGLLTMVLYDLNGNDLSDDGGACNLPVPSNEGGEVYCDINYTNKNIQDYYVCLKSNKDIDYKIKKEDKSPCGFYGEPPGSADKHDYYIFARAAKFSNIGNVVFDQGEYEGQENEGNLNESAEEYIFGRYPNCSSGCLIPLKFKSYGNLNINVYGLSLRYISGGIIRTTNSIYDASKEDAKLSSGAVELDLSLANITVPSTKGNYTFRLYLNDDTIFRDNIRVEDAPVIKNLFPTIVPASKETTFTLSVVAPSNRTITKYSWDFGDGWVTTTKNQTKYTYDEMGKYELKVEVEDNLGYKSKKVFEINVVSPKESVNFTIRTYKARLDNLTSKIATMPNWYKDKVKDLLNIEESISELRTLEQEYNSATSDEEYIKIMADLSQMEVPVTIKESSLKNAPFFVNINDINPNNPADFGAGDIDDNEEGYKEAIAAWSQDVLDLKISFKYVTAYYDDKTEDLLSVFNLEIKPKEILDKEMYVIIEGDDIVFSSQQDKKDFEGAVGVRFSKIEDKNLEFAIAKSVPLDKLALYISPEFSLLEVKEKVACIINGVCEEGENWKNCRDDCKPLGRVIILLIILFLFALIAYIVMQWWYKEKYESYLFKNRNDLYNLMNFVSNARSRGMRDNEISGKLRQLGWNGEQINYVFKKIVGKPIMPFDFLKLFKKFERDKLKSHAPIGRPAYINKDFTQKSF